MEITEKIRDEVIEKSMPERIRKTAQAHGMATLKESAVKKLLQELQRWTRLSGLRVFRVERLFSDILGFHSLAVRK